ncbi:MAG: hypothetical protein KJ621_11220 [Proteobacteria bacterium]|nr:hypothetical protein [Pseudomonadota bacterium]MBU1742235.1 hypothetical protein [Pseudomonadota bacterium]
MRRIACLSLIGLFLVPSAAAVPPPLPEERQPQTVVFQPYVDRTEGAFTLLVPRGWTIKGGVTRWSARRVGRGPNSSQAKIDVTVRRGQRGEVMVRWYPRLHFFDPGIAARPRLQGRTPDRLPQGTILRSLLDPHGFNTRFLLPRLHPRATILRLYQGRDLPGLARVFAQTTADRDRVTYRASRTIVTYREGGRVYYEVIITVIESIRPLGGRSGVFWANQATLIVRTPLRRINTWQAVLAETARSFRLNRRWLARQDSTPGQRGLRPGRRSSIDRRTADHRRRIDALVRHYMWRYRTFQQAYVNPYTNQVETGSALWRCRWVSPDGRVIYTNDRGYDPNQDRRLKGWNWKKSPARNIGDR